jgi:predicted transcriptional regulator
VPHATLTAQVTDDFAAEIDSIAAELERPRAWVVEDALREYVERHRLELERWRQTEQAIQAAERGEVVPAEEVFAWLDTWGRESIPPK